MIASPTAPVRGWFRVPVAIVAKLPTLGHLAVAVYLDVPHDLRRHPATWHMARAAAYGRWAA